MPRVPPFDRAAAYEDLAKVPNNMVAEIVSGELHATPRPVPRHAHVGSRIGVRIGGPFDDGLGGPGGWRVLYEPQIHFDRDVVVPDWAGWRRSRMPRLPDTAYFALAPDWVCEILSPSTAALDRVRKLAIYARERVAHAWLVDPDARTLEVLGLGEGRWIILATHAGSEVVRAEPFGEIELELSALWEDAPEP